VEKEREQVRIVQQPESPENRIRMAEIQKSLSRLDPIYREPFLMHFEGFKYQEVADKLDLPIGTVKSRIFQARKRLMHMLSDQPAAL
jgi:RNA polymerase sigma-70 factor (ECF subfamily)